MIQARPPVIKAKTVIASPFRLWWSVRKQSGEFSWVLGGKCALLGANAVVMLFLANHLELNMYGLLVTTIMGQLLISRFLLMGVDAGMVRLSATPELKSRSRAVVTAGLVLIVVASSVLLLLMLVVTPVLTRFNVRWWVLPCIAVGSIGTALVDYGYSFRLARHEYRAAAFVQSGTAMWRLGLIALVTTKLSAYPVSMFVAYHGASLFSGVVQSLLISQVLQRPDRALIKRLWLYSFWLGKANIVVIFSLYQGTLLLMLLNQSAAAGLYGLALTLSLGFSAISTTYSEYLLVKVRSAENLSRFIPRAVLGALILVVVSAPLVVLIATVLPWFLKAELIPVIPIFICVAASMSLLILQGPLVAICHYLLRPHLITVGWVLRAVFIGVIGVILAPRMGSMGAAIAQLIGSGLALIPLTLLVATSLRSDMKLQSAEVAHASPDSISSEGVMF